MRNRKDMTPIKTPKQQQQQELLGLPASSPLPPTSRFVKKRITRPMKIFLPLVFVLLTIIIFTLLTFVNDWEYISARTSTTRTKPKSTITTSTNPMSGTTEYAAAAGNKSNIQLHHQEEQHHKDDNNDNNPIGAIVLLAPARYATSMWNIDRFCLLLRAIRSVDLHLNSKFGPYPIYILIPNDYDEYSQQQKLYLNRTTISEEGPYAHEDRQLIKRWATNHTPTDMIHFIDFNLYTGDAIEPNTSYQQIYDWRKGKNDGIQGTSLGYQSMCRLWSGRIQQDMDFLNKYKYYLRMDDDSLLIGDVQFDPFIKMEQFNLTYAYRRDAYDHWGIDRLWNLSIPFLDFDKDLPFVVDRGHGSADDYLYGFNNIYIDNNNTGDDDHDDVDTKATINTKYEKQDKQNSYYDGGQPYNNFHVTRIDFWRSNTWSQLWNIYNQNQIWSKYRVGDANVHAIAMMLMDPTQIQVWDEIPYVHNSNDYGSQWWQNIKTWSEECHESYRQHLL